MPRSFLITRTQNNDKESILFDAKFGSSDYNYLNMGGVDNLRKMETPFHPSFTSQADGFNVVKAQIDETVNQNSFLVESVKIEPVSAEENDRDEEAEEDEMDHSPEDHDYVEVKKISSKEDEDGENDYCHNSKFFNLAQLAEISLAAEGKSEDKALSEQIRKVRQRHFLDNFNSNSYPSISENSHQLVICSNNNINKTSIPLNNKSKMGVAGKKKNDRRFPQSHNCSECGKSYSTSSNLARHRQTHRSPQDKKAKKCPHCSKIYVSMPAFSMHLRTHNQTCKCQICGKSFSRPWLLQGHIRTHTGERPFPCHLCAKAFADKSNLRAHIQTHSNSKPFACKKCGKTFALKSYLYKHEESACSNSIKNIHSFRMGQTPNENR